MSTATLNSEKKKVSEPNLRFQGFEGKWKTCLLKDVTKYTKGFAFKSEDYQEKGIRIVRVSDLSVDSIKTDNEKVYIDEDKSHLHEKYKLKSGNIIITTVGSKPEMIESAVGRGIYIKNNNEGLLNQNMLKFENIKNVDNAYVIGLINSKKYQHYMKSIARGNANQANITVVDLLQFPISFPTFPEQQKIASFLSKVDEKIQQLSRKKELLSQYKKGVMQQLFSGKLRFKDENGKEYPDWEEKKLGEVAIITMGQSPESKSYNTESQGMLLIQGNADIKERVTLPRQWTKEPTKTCKIGDLILTVRAPVGSIAKSKHNACIGRGVCSITNKKNSVLEFVYQFLLSYETKWGSLEQGSTFSAVSGSDIKSLKLNLPTLLEQQKIANFLSGIDGKIEQVNGELVKTQEFKKGLLQQMFV